MTSQALFPVPAGAAAVVHIIDTKVRMTGLPTNWLLTPGVDGFDVFPPLASWSFLIQSSRGEKLLFDLSFPPDPRTYPPAAQDLIKPVAIEGGNKHVVDILRENGVDPAEVGSVVWR